MPCVESETLMNKQQVARTKSGFRNVLGIGDTNGRLSGIQCDRWIVERSDRTRCRIRMCRTAGDPRQRGRAVQNSEWTPCGPSFWGRHDAFGNFFGVGGKAQNGLPTWAFFSEFVPPFLSSKKHESVNIRKPCKKMDRPKTHVLSSVRF